MNSYSSLKILFVCSGNNQGNPTYLVFNQGESLKKQGLSIEYFTILGKGIWGYLRNVPKLRCFLKSNAFSIVHAHYSLSGFVVSIAFLFIKKEYKPKFVVSLLGSDAYTRGWKKFLTTFFYKFSWNKTIVKTKRMQDILNLKEAVVLPNGVDLERFVEKDINTSRRKLGIEFNDKLVLFIADPTRIEKNFPLAKESVSRINQQEVILQPVYQIPNENIPDYLNAANVLLLTSLWEGSVNVVKEAMACNLPIVSTDVGDVKENIKDIDGCYIVSNDPDEIAGYILKALNFNSRTNGRERLISLGLDSKTVANKLIVIYKELLNE